jgi:hypothetical protein
MTTKLTKYQQTLLAVIDACGRANPSLPTLTPMTLYNFAWKHMDRALASTPTFRSFHALGDKHKAWDVVRGARESLVVAVNPHYVAPPPVEALFAPGQKVYSAGDRTKYRVISTDKEGWVRLSWASHGSEQHQCRHQRNLYRIADNSSLGCLLATNDAPAPLTEEK